MLKELDFEKYVQKSDLIITGEGKVDHQTEMGKGADIVATIAKQHNKPCICIGGNISPNEFNNFSGVFSILR